MMTLQDILAIIPQLEKFVADLGPALDDLKALIAELQTNKSAELDGVIGDGKILAALQNLLNLAVTNLPAILSIISLFAKPASSGGNAK